jgi:hypothetical protein
VQRQKDRLERLIVSGDYSPMRYYWFSFGRIPDLMCCGCFVPKWDFQARRIQDLRDLQADLGSMAVSLPSSGEMGCAILAWHLDHDNTCLPFVRSLVEMPGAQVPHALVRLITGSMGNQFWSPRWWDARSVEIKTAILERFRTTVSPSKPIPPDCLTDDGVRAVSWEVISRQTNVAGLA